MFSLKRLSKERKNEINEVNISIVIAAKNEQENINLLVQHLKKINYPADKFEVIFVDDNSTDDTYSRIKEQINPLKNFYLFDGNTEEIAGKRDALSLGINKSHFSYILITDADCRMERDWLKSYSNHFQNGYEILFGIAPFYMHTSLVNKLSCYENLRSSILTFSLASLGMPYSAAARNFGFSKNVFESLGGYAKTIDTKSGDDDLLIREAVKKKMKIGFITNPGSFVFSETKNTFSEYLQQKARHTQTSFHYLLKHQLILGIWHLINLVILFSPILIFINQMFGFLLLGKLVIDFVTVKLTQKKFSYSFKTLEIFYLQIFYELLLVVHFLNAKFNKIKWK